MHPWRRTCLEATLGTMVQVKSPWKQWEKKNKVATVKMERMGGPAGGWQVEAAQYSRQQRAWGRECEGTSARRLGAGHGWQVGEESVPWVLQD